MSVVVFGSANTDLTVESSRFPEPGETLTGTHFASGLGGKGLNQAVAAARLGAETIFVGRVGEDAFGGELRAGLAAAGVDVGDLSTDRRTVSGVAVIHLSTNGQNSIVVVPGANGTVDHTDVARLDARLRSADVLVAQLELPMSAVVGAVELAARHGVRVLLDPAPTPPGGLPAALYAPHVILTPNEVETAMLVGFDVADDAAVERAARSLLDRGAGAVVLKLGERGLCWATADGLGREETLRVSVVDTVGAGDAVNGALAAALSAGATLSEASREAAMAGALSVTRAGSYAAMPTRAELLATLDQYGADLTIAAGSA